MRSRTPWLIPRRSASCCWVSPRCRRASRTSEPMRHMALDSCAGVPALDSCAGVPALDSCAGVPALDSCAGVPALDSCAGVPALVDRSREDMAVSGEESVAVTGRRYLAGEIPPTLSGAVAPGTPAHGERSRKKRCPAVHADGGCADGGRLARLRGVDVLVTGGTGRLGKRLMAPLQAAGHTVRQMSRRGTGPGGVRGDLATGRDLPLALVGAELVIHAASNPRDPWQVDAGGTRRLVEAGARPRLRHLIYISIVGVDGIPYGYYRAKFAAEQVLLASGLPVTLLRVTQFHDFVDFLLDTARRGPVVPVPMNWRVQTVDVGEVATHIAEVAARPPVGGVVEYGGPEELSAADIARAWVAVRAPGAHVVATPVPGRLSAALRDGAALPSGGARGRRTYAEHLRG